MIPLPLPDSIHRFLTVAGRVSFGKVFNCNCAWWRTCGGNVWLRATYRYALRTTSVDRIALRLLISRRTRVFMWGMIEGCWSTTDNKWDPFSATFGKSFLLNPVRVAPKHCRDQCAADMDIVLVRYALNLVLGHWSDSLTSYRMLSKSLRFSNHQRRTFVSSLFGFTFFATVLTVSASTMLPCPARASKIRFADGVEEKHPNQSRIAVVEKKPKRWIEEIPKSWLLLLLLQSNIIFMWIS